MRLITALALAILACLAGAHDLELTGVIVTLGSKSTSVVVRIPYSRLVAREGGEPMGNLQIDLAIRRRLKLALDGHAIKVEDSSVVVDGQSDFVTWSTQARASKSAMLTARLFPEDPASRTLLTIKRSGEVSTQTIADQTSPDQASGAQNGWRFLPMGFQHILSGPDHILFVFGLILLGGGLKSLLKIVTAFTLAHSLTLALAATHVWNPSPRMIEPLIALSIVAIAVENLRPQQSESPTPSKRRDFRPAVAFAFGLVHGFGFSETLSQLGISGFPLAIALITFNLGVEFGQASIILLATPFVAVAQQLPGRTWATTSKLCSATIGLIGGYWFAERLLG